MIIIKANSHLRKKLVMMKKKMVMKVKVVVAVIGFIMSLS